MVAHRHRESLALHQSVQVLVPEEPEQAQGPVAAVSVPGPVAVLAQVAQVAAAEQRDWAARIGAVPRRTSSSPYPVKRSS